jgi:transcriptional regulator with XRE-family HTH domain
MSTVSEQTSLKENLQKLLDSSGLRASDLAERTQIPASTIKYILSGNTYNPRIETLSLIADYFKVSIDELYRGAPGETLLRPSFASNSAVPTDEAKRVPILEWKSIKDWFSPQQEALQSNKEIEWVTVDGTYNEFSFALTIDSEGKIIFPKSSIILVEPQKDYREDNYVVVSINKNIPTIRKIFEDSGTLYFRSLAAPLPPEKVEPQHLIWGKITECRVLY